VKSAIERASAKARAQIEHINEKREGTAVPAEKVIQ
jgi:hypothetical protein